MSGCLTSPQTVLQSVSPQASHVRDHRIAESLQRVLLRTLSSDGPPGLCLSVFYEAALEEATVGGDSCDVFALAGERVGLVVADASGKGLAAAERIAEIRFALRAFLHEHDDPSRALSCLNDFVCNAKHLGTHDDATFATLTLAVLDIASGELTCLCAGGEPPLVLRADGTVEVVQICGAALGLLPNQGYSVARIDLEAGDAVLLVTDGLTEARNLTYGSDARIRRDAFLGLEGLIQLAANAHNVTPLDNSAALSQIGRAIFEGVRAFAGGSFHDDACLLIGRRETR